MTTYTINHEHNGIEISFSEKPNRDTLDLLKASGYRWHGVKKVWYAKRTGDRLTLAEKIASDTPINAPIDRQSELKKTLEKIVSEYWKDPKMVKYCMKSTAYIVELSDGDIYTIDKPSIETHFCFGYGYSGVSTEEDYKNANDAMHYADTHEDYFISENMKQIDGYIDSLKDESLRIYKYIHYCGECDKRYKDICFIRYYESPASNLKDCKEITSDERQALIAGYEEVKKQFRKRLDTYLKKYGLSKLHTWTYLSD